MPSISPTPIIRKMIAQASKAIIAQSSTPNITQSSTPKIVQSSEAPFINPLTSSYINMAGAIAFIFFMVFVIWALIIEYHREIERSKALRKSLKERFIVNPEVLQQKVPYGSYNKLNLIRRASSNSLSSSGNISPV